MFRLALVVKYGCVFLPQNYQMHSKHALSYTFLKSSDFIFHLTIIYIHHKFLWLCIITFIQAVKTWLWVDNADQKIKDKLLAIFELVYLQKNGFAEDQILFISSTIHSIIFCWAIYFYSFSSISNTHMSFILIFFFY